MIETTYDDDKRRAFLSSGQIIYGVHTSNRCLGDVCPIHKPSDHEYRGLPLAWEEGIFWRYPDEETRIVDPDDYTLRSTGSVVVRNSARCLICCVEVFSNHRHHFATCPCGNIFVDGGHNYLRRGAEKPHKMEDTSEVYTLPEV